MTTTIESLGAMMQGLIASQCTKNDLTEVCSKVDEKIEAQGAALSNLFSAQLTEIRSNASAQQALRAAERAADNGRLIRLEHITDAIATEMKQVALANRESWPALHRTPVNPGIGAGANGLSTPPSSSQVAPGVSGNSAKGRRFFGIQLRRPPVVVLPARNCGLQ